MSSSEFFRSGSILFLKNYQFPDGSSSDKILIVLCSSNDNSAIIYSLTTSKDRLPQELEKHGCQESVETDMSVFVFEAGKVVGTSTNKTKKYSFDKNTFLFFQADIIIETTIADISQFISSGRISKLGRLFSSELRSLLECILNSSFVKKGIQSKIRTNLSANDLNY